MWAEAGRLSEFHGEVPLEVRLLKLTEEVGEAAEALIGMRGLNSRKGLCRTEADLMDELAGVIITATVTMAAVNGSAGHADRHFDQRLAAVVTRAGL